MALQLSQSSLPQHFHKDAKSITPLFKADLFQDITHTKMPWHARL